MKTVAIIQARMGATRLPNKMMLHLHGHPVIEWVYYRVKHSANVDDIVFAIPDTEQDDVLAWYLESINAKVFRGSESDLVGRFFQAAMLFSAEQIVRVCADNPFVSASEIDRLIDFFNDCDCDYAFNHVPRGSMYPDGLGAEICNVNLLEELNAQATLPDHREHLFNYILDNKRKYTVKTFDPPDYLAYPDLKLDLDTFDDYMRLLQGDYHIDMNAIDIVNIAKMG